MIEKLAFLVVFETMNLKCYFNRCKMVNHLQDELFENLRLISQLRKLFIRPVYEHAMSLSLYLFTLKVLWAQLPIIHPLTGEVIIHCMHIHTQTATIYACRQQPMRKDTGTHIWKECICGVAHYSVQLMSVVGTCSRM